MGNLDLIVHMHNSVETTLLPVERPLLQQQLDRIDLLLSQGIGGERPKAVALASSKSTVGAKIGSGSGSGSGSAGGGGGGSGGKGSKKKAGQNSPGSKKATGKGASAPGGEWVGVLCVLERQAYQDDSAAWGSYPLFVREKSSPSVSARALSTTAVIAQRAEQPNEANLAIGALRHVRFVVHGGTQDENGYGLHASRKARQTHNRTQGESHSIVQSRELAVRMVLKAAHRNSRGNVSTHRSQTGKEFDSRVEANLAGD